MRIRISQCTLVLLGCLLGGSALVGCRDAPYEAIRTTGTPSQPPPFQPPTGGMPAPPPPSGPFQYVVPGSSTDWNADNPNVVDGVTVGKMYAQESGQLRLEVRANYGGAIQIYDKLTGQYLINFFDKGRETGYASYSGPADFARDAPYWKYIGYNPLQAGDAAGHPSPVVAHGLVDGWLYTKTQCLSWPHVDARRLAFYYEQWARLDDNKVYVKVRLTHERTDTTFYPFAEQEWPFLMVNGAKNVHFYNGDAPFSYGPTTVTNGIERRTPTGGYVLHQLTPFGLTEPWQGVEVGQSGGEARLLGLYSEDCYRANYNVSQLASNDNWEGGNTITYVAGRPIVNLDARGVWYRQYDLVVGSERQIREHAYARSQLVRPTKLDFLFSRINGRCGWYVLNGGHDQNEPFTQDHWRVIFDGQRDPADSPLSARNSKLLSPYSSWVAGEQGGVVYVRLAYRGSESRLRLAWLVGGQAPDGVDSAYPNQSTVRFPKGARPNGDDSQALDFEVVSDGALHTYRLAVGNKASWRGIIQQLELTHVAGTGVIAPGEQLELAYVGTTDPGN